MLVERFTFCGAVDWLSTILFSISSNALALSALQVGTLLRRERYCALHLIITDSSGHIICHHVESLCLVELLFEFGWEVGFLLGLTVALTEVSSGDVFLR